jgi:hypothetical protein
MTATIQAPHADAADVLVVPAAPREPEASATRHSKDAPAPRTSTRNRCGRPKTDGSGPCPAPVARPGKACPFHDDSPDAKARMALARKQGGHAPRVRMGLAPAVVEAVDLRTSDGQLAVLSAATRALAQGSISSTTATALATLVKTAAGVIQGDQEQAIRELESRVARLVDSRVVSAGR